MIVVSIVHALLNPIIIFWILVCGAAVSWKLGKSKTFRVLVVTSLGWLFLVTTSPVPQWLVFGLEKDFTAINLRDIQTDKPVDILVLGGGHAIANDLPSTGQLMPTALARLTEAIRIHRQLPGSKIICSGYSVSKRTTQAQMLGLAALELGVDPADTMLLIHPENTKEEAMAYAQRFGPDRKLILVTSAYHMKRAILYLRSRGLNPVAAPANHLMKYDTLNWRYDLYPDEKKIHMMQSALHEYAGLLKFHVFDNQEK
jgi:uncharacterized SAM-binding protein YcdF (DUF218 family)